MKLLLIVGVALLLAMPVFADVELVAQGNYTGVQTNQTFEVTLRYRVNETQWGQFWIEAYKQDRTYDSGNFYELEEGAVSIDGMFDRYGDNYTLVNLSGYTRKSFELMFYDPGVYEIAWGFLGLHSVEERFFVFVNGSYYNTTQMRLDWEEAVNRSVELKLYFKDHPEVLRRNMTMQQLWELQRRLLMEGQVKNGTRNVTVQKRIVSVQPSMPRVEQVSAVPKQVVQQTTPIVQPVDDEIVQLKSADKVNNVIVTNEKSSSMVRFGVVGLGMLMCLVSLGLVLRLLNFGCGGVKKN